MISFLVGVALLIIGFFTYGKLVEKIFGINDRAKTPAITKNDGVDFVPMKPWKVFLIQFLNIAGLGPIFGAIMGIFYGPSAMLWIVFGSIFAGGVHDYLSGMISLRSYGKSLPDIIGHELGPVVRAIIRVVSVILLVLLATTFMSGPAVLLQNLLQLKTIMFHGHVIPIVWCAIIFVYYIVATVLPIDKLIGRFYPVFGAVLLFMGVGIMIIMLGWHSSEMPEVFDGLQNRQPSTMPILPMMFVSIACGAISGFHGTQSPLMSRCMASETHGRWIFYGAMICEGILALIWASAAGTFFADPEHNLYGIEGLKAFAAQHPGENIAALVVQKISHTWLGIVGGILAVLGVVVAPITSGDTALRSARLVVADALRLDQKPILNRLAIAVPIFIIVGVMLFVDFQVVWRYFSWFNQTLAMFTLWACANYLYRQEFYTNLHGLRQTSKYRYGYIVAVVPALFMTMVSASYLLISPEGVHLPERYFIFSYVLAIIATFVAWLLFRSWKLKYENYRLRKLL